MDVLQKTKELQFDVIRGEERSEEDVRQSLNYDIQEYLASERYNMKINFRNEVKTSKRTFIDSKYENFIIEYKKPSVVLGKEEEKQLLEYIEDQEDHNCWGILTNGKDINIYLYNYGDNGWELIKDKQNSGVLDDSKFKYICDCIAKRDHLVLTKNNINGYFGVEKNKHIIKKIFKHIVSNSISPKTRLLYREWLNLFNLSEGDDFNKTKDDEVIRFYSELLDTKIDSIDLEHKALFSIQTYYSIIVKMIFYRIILQRKGGENRSPKFKVDFFKEIESNGFYGNYGILNLIDGDFFSWYLDEFTEEEYVELYEKMDDVYTIESDRIQLLCIKFYENIFPFWVRHAMGEYYTPDYLADTVVNTSVNMFGGNNIKLLDPTCGSGVFLLSALQNDSISEIYGVDINPLAVLTSKINYLINNFKINSEELLEIPVYLGDSTYIPVEENINGVICYKYSLGTSIEDYRHIDFVFAKEVVNEKKFFMILDEIENQIKRKNKGMALHIIKSYKSFHYDELGEYYEGLINTLISLEEKNLNSIWLKIIGNYLKSGSIRGVDVIVGNPPWVQWGCLPDNYRLLIKDNCRIEGLFSNDKNSGGVDLNISALIAHVSIRDRLSRNGVLGFLMPDSILFNVSFQGFRNMEFPNGEKFCLNRVVRRKDSNLKPFDPVTLPFAEYYFSFTQSETQVIEVNGSEKKAIKKEDSFNNHYVIATEEELVKIKSVWGKNNLEFHSGVGLVKGGHYLLKFKQKINDEVSEFYPYEKIGPKTLGLSNRVIKLETDLVYPFVKSPDIDDNIITEVENYCLFPFPRGEKEPYPLEYLREKYPFFYNYYMSSQVQRDINSGSKFNDRIQKTSYNVGVFRVGPYSYSDWFLVTRDNTKSVFSLVGKIMTPWGELKQPIFDGHTNYLSCVNDNPLTERQGKGLLKILTTEGVKLYIEKSSDARSMSSRLYNDIDIKNAFE